MTESRFKVPHTLVLLFGMVVLAQILTYVLPQGAFERVESHGHDVVVAGTYKHLEEPQLLPWHAAFTTIPIGFKESQGIIFFVFIIGGAFGVFRATGAADALIGWLLRTLSGVPAALIAGGLFVFAAGSSTIGMAEEYIPFVPLLLALCAALGFDAVTAIGILCVGYGTGYGVAVANPFTVVIAQNIAGIDEFSGWGFRLAITLPFLLIAFQHVYSYASRVRKDPAKSLVHGLPSAPSLKPHQEVPVTPARLLILLLLIATLGLIVWGIKVHEWYLTEMTALFFAVSVAMVVLTWTGREGRLGPDGWAKNFCEGAAELTTTALLIGVARTVEQILVQGQIIDSIINGIAEPLERLGPSLAAVGMFGVQCVCNLFIPSGSGQAYVTMPIMAPLADLVGVSRQTSVLAYQFGDGFTNIIVPTNPVLVGILAMAGIPYDRWLRFIFPFIAKMFVAGSIALVIAVKINYS